MRGTAWLLLFSIGLSACGGSSTPTTSDSGASSATPTPTVAASPTAAASPEATASATPGSDALIVDALADVLVEDLTLRAASSTDAQSIGLLPFGEPAYVVAGPREAEGYAWYQIASVRGPYRGGCGEPEPAPSLGCRTWIGWAAAGTPEGDVWLRAGEPQCPPARDTAAYLGLLPAARLACAGDDGWVLTAYLAPQGGRGCPAAWLISPGWMGPCTLLFPQPTESAFDGSTEMQVFMHPTVGDCGLPGASSCPFDELIGSWVELVGSLDDPASSECRPELSGLYETPPSPPPNSELVVFECRTRFVVTELRPVGAPES